MLKRICIVGGEDVHKRIPMSEILYESGYQITIIGTCPKSFPEFIEYIDYNLYRKFSIIRDYKTYLWLKKFFIEREFDVIQTFDTKPAFLLPLALSKNKTTPIIRTITGLGTIFMSESIFSKILRQVYLMLHRAAKRRVFKTVFQNEDDQNLFIKYHLVNKENTALILSSGIDLKSITIKAPRNNSIFTFICVARLVYEKGIVNLLEAARICKNKGYHFKYLLVGPLEENSKRLNQDILNQYKDIVDFLGSRNDVMSLLLESDAFVLPTFREGFSRVLLEAGAVGLPIVSTNVTGVREFARQGIEGLLVNVQDSNGLAEAMIQIATNKKLADNLAENALKHVEMFSIEAITKQYMTIFDQAINQ